MQEWNSAPWNAPVLKRQEADAGRLSAVLAGYGWRRWWLAGAGQFLADGYRLCADDALPPSPLLTSVLGTLASFARSFTSARIKGSRGSLGRALEHCRGLRTKLWIEPSRWKRAEAILRRGVDTRYDWDQHVHEGRETLAVEIDDELWQSARRVGADYSQSLAALLLCLVAPNPLEQLVADLAGHPEAVRSAR
jgi:hypothetical protein